MNKFGFWIIPENNAYTEFDEIIHTYSSTFGSPLFVPHISLHGVVSSTDEEVIAYAQTALKDTKSFDVAVGAVEFSTTYFQCVFARIKANAELCNAHLAIKNAFNVENVIPLMPHISLIYGDFDMKTREKIAKEIEIKNASFKANKITIVRADTSDPKDWTVVDQITLQ